MIITDVKYTPILGVESDVSGIMFEIDWENVIIESKVVISRLNIF